MIQSLSQAVVQVGSEVRENNMQEHDRQVLFSKKSDEWATPQWLFDELNKVHQFTLDPASTDENCKCPNHFTMQDDGLTKDWARETVFINPPYSGCFDWVKKAHEEAQKLETKVVMLLPARTDTKWFHQFCLESFASRIVRHLQLQQSTLFLPATSYAL